MTHPDIVLVMDEVHRLRREAEVHTDGEVNRALTDAADRLERVAQRLMRTLAKPSEAR